MTWAMASNSSMLTDIRAFSLVGVGLPQTWPELAGRTDDFSVDGEPVEDAAAAEAVAAAEREWQLQQVVVLFDVAPDVVGLLAPFAPAHN